MQSLMKAWAKKAEADLATSRRELYAEELPNYSAVCRFAHESALGYLKARLTQHGIPYPATDQLVVLLELILPEEPEWVRFRPHLRSLSHISSQMEDPECVPDAPTAAEAQSLAKMFRDQARIKLGLVSHQAAMQPRLFSEEPEQESLQIEAFGMV